MNNANENINKLAEMGVFAPPPDEKNRSYADKVLCLALDIGENILLCGGEINRVENTIERICKAYEAEHIEVFTINSLIVAAIRLKDGSYSNQMRRMGQAGKDLYHLERFNALSRRICAEKTPVDEALELVIKTKDKSPYPAIFSIIGAFFATSAFAVFFGGSLLDALVAGIAGIIIYFIDQHSPSYINRIASTVICSFIAGTLAHLAVLWGLGHSVDHIMIGIIMILIPGITFGYALRDFLFGDLLSGLLKLVEAILLAVMIALGFALPIIIMGGLVA